MATTKNLIVAYEHDRLLKCDEACNNCVSEYIDSSCCINYCKPTHFKELYDYCVNKNIDCGFDYISKEKCIKFDKYTGIIQLKDGTYLEILPKIDKNTKLEDSRKVFENLIFASHNLTNEYKHNKISDSDTRKDNHIIEIFISVFCKDILELLKRGIKKSYIRKSENLNNYKGKLNFSEHIKHNITSKNKFFVEYSEFSLDIPENRILKSACLYLIKQTEIEENKKVLRRLLIELDDVSPCTNLDKDLQEKQINRLHEYYSRPLQYAEFFLRHDNFIPRRGRTALPALLFPLNKMFEDYIENLFKQSNVDYRVQYSRYNLIFTGEKELFNTQMDYVITSKDKSRKLILDAKWKELDINDEKLGVSQTDLYQLHNYASIIRDKEVGNVSIMLLYPQTLKFNQVKEWTYFDGIPIYIIPVNVLDKEKNDKLFDIIQNI